MFLTSLATTRLNTHRFQLAMEVLEDRLVPSADTVLEWNQIALDAMVNDSYLGSNAKQAGPDRSSRALAMVSISVFDAVNSIDRSYDPYLIQVKAPNGASIDAAAAQAAHDALVYLYPDYKPELDNRLAADLAEVTSVSARNAGIQVGKTVAAAIITSRLNDGSAAPMHYQLSNLPGHWSPDPLHPTQMPVGPEWGNVAPFAVRSAEQFQIPKPPALTSQQYTEAYNEMIAYGGDGVNTPTIRTAEQTEIGIFWGYDGSRGLSTPPRLYNQIAATLAVQQGNTEVQNARMFALVNTAMADAGIACWDDKYQFDFWRPVTAIRAGDSDGNPLTIGDPTWTPLGAPNNNGGGTNFTPPFPAYASGHATFGAALFRTLERFYGTDNISFTIGSDEYNGITTDQHGIVRPVVTRSFTSFSEAAEENGQSRIYLGIHWKFDKDQGIHCGDHIADYVFQNYFRPRSKASLNAPVLAQFIALKANNGAIVLTTTDGRNFNPLLGKQPSKYIVSANASNTQDTKALVADLMTRMDKGAWGPLLRRGKTLQVDLTSAKGPVFSVTSFLR